MLVYALTVLPMGIAPLGLAAPNSNTGRQAMVPVSGSLVYTVYIYVHNKYMLVSRHDFTKTYLTHAIHK